MLVSLMVAVPFFSYVQICIKISELFLRCQDEWLQLLVCLCQILWHVLEAYTRIDKFLA